jgi:SAM-dependent methyltransferase
VSPWWRRHFDDVWYRLHRGLFPEQRSRQEVAAMVELLGLPLGARVLDGPCGWGRHTAPLAEAGFLCVGADLSLPLLRRAVDVRGADGPAGSRAAPTVVAADLAALPFAEGAFDAVIDVFTSVGLFDDDEREVAALSELRRVTRPGGRLLLETIHREDVERHFAERDRLRVDDGTRVRIRRRWDAERGVAHERWRWRTPEGGEGRSRHRLRVYAANEVLAFLETAGYRPEELMGDWDGSPFTGESPRLIVLAAAV